MKSRLTILAMLVAGILLSTTGAGLAVSGMASGDDAAMSQYATPTPEGNVLGEEESGGSSRQPAGEAQGQPVPAAHRAQQVEAGSSSELPFTGLPHCPSCSAAWRCSAATSCFGARTRGDQS